MSYGPKVTFEAKPSWRRHATVGHGVRRGGERPGSGAICRRIRAARPFRSLPRERSSRRFQPPQTMQRTFLLCSKRSATLLRCPTIATHGLSPQTAWRQSSSREAVLGSPQQLDRGLDVITLAFKVTNLLDDLLWF